MNYFNPYTPRFELYSTNTTNFWSYDLDKNNVNPFDICINFACDNRKSKHISSDVLKKELDKNNINGFRFHNCAINVDDGYKQETINLSRRITYLKLYYYPNSSFYDDNVLNLVSCIKFFKNLKQLEVVVHSNTLLCKKLWKELSNRNLEYLSIEINSLNEEKMPNMSSLYDDETMRDIFLRIVNQTKKVNFDNNMWQILMKQPDVFYKAREKAGKHILSLDTTLIDQSNLTDTYLQMFTSFSPNGKGTIRINEMKNPDNISHLFEYINKNQLKFKCIYIGWWPSNHPSFSCPTNKLHFWESEYIPVIKRIIETTSGIKKITSGLKAITCAELDDLQKYIKNLGLIINTDGIHVSDMKNKKQSISVNVKVPSFEFLVNETLNYYSDTIEDYKSAKVWRSMHRMSLEEAHTMCVYLFSKLNHDSSRFSKLRKAHQKAISAKKLLSMTNIIPDDLPSKLILVSEIDGSEETIEISQTTDLQNIKNRILFFKEKNDIKILKENVKSGKTILPVKLNEFKEGYKTQQVQLKLWNSYDHLDDLFCLMEHFPDSIYKIELLLYWDFKDSEKLPHFKRYMQTYFTHLRNWDFSELISQAKEYDPYRMYLLSYAEEKSIDIFEDLRPCYFNLILLQDYYNLASQKGWNAQKFVKRIFYDICGKNYSNLEEVQKMINYLCNLIDIGNSGKSIVNWAKSVKFSLHSFNNCRKDLIQLGYFKEIKDVEWYRTWEDLEANISY